MTRPLLIVVCGVPGVGKSVVAEAFADERDAKRHETDRIRKELFDDPTYSGEESQTVYNTLQERAERDLKNGDDVVLDATFNLEIGRRTAVKRAASADARVMFVKVECDDAVARQRIRNRDGISDADIEVYEKIKEEFEALDRPHAVVDNSGSLDDTLERVEELAADPQRAFVPQLVEE